MAAGSPSQQKYIQLTTHRLVWNSGVILGVSLVPCTKVSPPRKNHQIFCDKDNTDN